MCVCVCVCVEQATYVDTNCSIYFNIPHRVFTSIPFYDLRCYNNVPQHYNMYKLHHDRIFNTILSVGTSDITSELRECYGYCYTVIHFLQDTRVQISLLY